MDTQNPTPQIPQNAPTPDSFDHKINRVTAYGIFLKAVAALAWAIIFLLIVLGLFGTCNRRPAPNTSRQPITHVIPSRSAIPFEKINGEIREALAAAKAAALAKAGAELDRWTSELLARTESEFLPWYFNYFNQQAMTIDYVYTTLAHRINPDSPSAEDKLCGKIQHEFSTRVLSAEPANLHFERIVKDAVTVFTDTLRGRIEKIPAKFNLTATDWNTYLEASGKTIRQVEGSRQVPLTVKCLTVPVAYGAILAGRIVVNAVRRMLEKLSARLAEKAAAKIVVRGGAIAAKAAGMGARLLAPILTVGLVGWEAADHAITVRQERPGLLNAVRQLLGELRENLLSDPVTGVAAVLNTLEDEIILSLPPSADNSAAPKEHGNAR